jgi:lipopolysaccharide/colanic/teichoic acid biosynthesis glycosyltransferase
MEEITILKNATFEAGASEETNALWETVVPGVTGWVQIPSPRDFDLPQGLPSFDSNSPDDEVYIVTWGHQHHCLVRFPTRHLFAFATIDML